MNESVILATSLYGALDVELSRGPVELTNVLKVYRKTCTKR